MARVIYGALITELAGSIGGLTFQKNASGNIARLKPNMPVNSSPYQLSQQSNLNELIALWPTLTLAQQATWNNFAAAHDHVNEFGETKILNGFQWFLSCNFNLMLVGEANILSAPAWTVIAAAPAFTLVNTAGHLTMHWGAAYTSHPNYVVTYLSQPMRQTSLKLRKNYLVGDVRVFNAVSDLNIEGFLSSLYNITWATFRADSECILAARVKVIETGTGLAGPYTTAQLKIG